MELQAVKLITGAAQTTLTTKLVCKVVGFEGEIVHDLTKPDGTPRKLMSADKLSAMGWTPKISLEDGIRDAYEAFLAGNFSDRALG